MMNRILVRLFFGGERLLGIFDQLINDLGDRIVFIVLVVSDFFDVAYSFDEALVR